MSIQQNETISKAWITAFNEKDLEALLSLYCNDALHFSPKLKVRLPETNGLIKGKNAMENWWKDAFERLPTLHYDLTNMVVTEHTVVIEYVRKVDHEEDILIAEFLEIEKGLIVKSRVYHG
jgi:ketosteroid isomerase-like protein